MLFYALDAFLKKWALYKKRHKLKRITLTEIKSKCNSMLPAKGVTSKMKMQIKKRCKLARGVNAKRQKTNGCAVRAGCMPNTHNMSAVNAQPQAITLRDSYNH